MILMCVQEATLSTAQCDFITLLQNRMKKRKKTFGQQADVQGIQVYTRITS